MAPDTTLGTVPETLGDPDLTVSLTSPATSSSSSTTTTTTTTTTEKYIVQSVNLVTSTPRPTSEY